MKHKLILILLLVGSAWALIPLENRIQATRIQRQYGGPPMKRDWRDVLGQQATIALLAGFRGVVADIAWLQSHGHWENREWLLQYKKMNMACVLQPHSVVFYELGSWHIAWNISYAAGVDTTVPEPERKRNAIEWIKKGEGMLLEGIKNNPQRYDLYFHLGFLYQEKWARIIDENEGYGKAADYYIQAYKFDDTPAFIGRAAARSLEKCGRVEEAYQFWIKLWREKDHEFKMPHIIQANIKELENRLNIPNEKRIFPPSPTVPAPG